MTVSDPNGVLYQRIIDQNLIELLKLGISMKQYFDSKFPFQPIDASFYPQYHKNRKALIIPSSEESILDVTRKYDEIIEDNIPADKKSVATYLRTLLAVYVLIYLTVFAITIWVLVPLSFINKVMESENEGNGWFSKFDRKVG
jgi:hypothetical protein